MSCVLTRVSAAQGQVTITVRPREPEASIPADFVGLSVETASLSWNHAGVHGYLFDSLNTRLVHLFRIIGIKNLRVGGGTVESRRVEPGRGDIDALFRFAGAAGVKVIYSFKLLNGDAKAEAGMAKYIWDRYRSRLDYFAIGNEPDWPHYHYRDPQIYETTPGEPGTAFPSFLAKWARFARVIRDSVPGAPFGGPDTGSDYPVPGSKNTYYHGASWTADFADRLKGTGLIREIFLHNYVGQAAAENTVPEMVDKMLSPAWDTSYYSGFYSGSCAPVLAIGFPYRLTESNSFTGGAKGGSDCFATALYALDYLYWWADHDASGVDFHNKQWLLNDTIYMDHNGHYAVHPMAYGIKAFGYGVSGRIESVSISNPRRLNLTAYAVRRGNSLTVTIINKEHGTRARSADVNITGGGNIGKAGVIFLSARGNDPFDTTGVTLGGAAITCNGKWRAEWKSLVPERPNDVVLNVPASSAAIVRIK